MVIDAEACLDDDVQLVVELVTAAFVRAGADADVRVARTLPALASVVRAAHGRISVVGGDRALHHLANLDGALPEIALLPYGNANGAADILGLPIGLDAVAALALDGPAVPFDVLRVEIPRQTVFVVGGLNVGARSERRQQHVAMRGTSMRGALGLLWSMGRAPGYTSRVELDGTPGEIRFDDATLAAASVRSSHAAPEPGGVVRLSYDAASSVAGGRGQHRGDYAVVEFVDRLPMTADGTLLGTHVARVTVASDRLRVVGSRH